MTKSPEAFRTISEVADDLDLPQHVLRFWETRFSQIKPMKRGGGRRYYRPDDVELLRGIKTLLYDEGYTIRGVQKLLKEQGNQLAVGIGRGDEISPVIAHSQEPAAHLNAVTEGQGMTIGDGSVEPGQSAVDVSTFSDVNTGGKKGKGILKRLTGIGDGSDEIMAGSAIAADDMKLLQSTLHELLECKRLLDQTRQD